MGVEVMLTISAWAYIASCMSNIDVDYRRFSINLSIIYLIIRSMGMGMGMGYFQCNIATSSIFDAGINSEKLR